MTILKKYIWKYISKDPFTDKLPHFLTVEQPRFFARDVSFHVIDRILFIRDREQTYRIG